MLISLTTTLILALDMWCEQVIVISFMLWQLYFSTTVLGFESVTNYLMIFHI